MAAGRRRAPVVSDGATVKAGLRGRTRSGSTLRLQPPRDFLLPRDVCSYGYFLLEPNLWDPARMEFRTTVEVERGVATTVRVTQGGEDRKPGDTLRVVCDRRLGRGQAECLRASLTRMLRLDEDEEHIRSFHRVDPRWKRSGRGRLIRSASFFEDLIKTVTSCNVAWPSTVRMNRRLCEVYGVRSPSELHSFPSAGRLARVRPSSLRTRCGVGYRDERIVRLAGLFTRSPRRGGLVGAWFEDRGREDDEILSALLELPGIGPYAAANVMQLLGRYRRLPIDTETFRHARVVLGMKGGERELSRLVSAHYAPFGEHTFRSYWFELWDFYESRRGPAHTWERETTGATFTAALLR